jgi:hypothetical protein
MALALLASARLSAAVLPEERADALYHAYDGGGVEIAGPSVLVRKSIGQSVSVYANYYVDNVSSASIDVELYASPYTEERNEIRAGVDYLVDKATLSLGYGNSEETDYTANTAFLGVSQDFFGDLSTLSMSFSVGSDEVRKTGDPTFAEPVDRQAYRINLSQIVTKSLIMGLSWELITDKGFLNNPYRQVRYLDDTAEIGYSFQDEIYPGTRTSDAYALRAKYFLPYRASLHAEYRVFDDNWGIHADNYELGYTHPLFDEWVLDLKFRHYSQTGATFYSDLFPRRNAQDFLARDKELSTFSSNTIGIGVSYEFAKNGWGFIDRGSLNVMYDLMQFDYKDFRNALVSKEGLAEPGEEPLYSFDANVLQLFVSIWY